MFKLMIEWGGLNSDYYMILNSNWPSTGHMFHGVLALSGYIQHEDDDGGCDDGGGGGSGGDDDDDDDDDDVFLYLIDNDHILYLMLLLLKLRQIFVTWRTH